MSYRYNNLYIMHYGVARRSGRYPWGSGDRPYQGDDMGKIKLDNFRLEARAKSAPEFEKSNVFKDAGGDFATDSNVPPGDAVKYTGDPVRFTNQFNSKPVDDYKQKDAKPSSPDINLNDVKEALSEIENGKQSLSSLKKDENIKKAVDAKKRESAIKGVTGGMMDTYKGVDSMVKEVRAYQQGKLSDKAKRRLDRKIRKMSDAQLSELARRMSLESNAIEQSNRRKKLTAATGKSRTEHLMDLGLANLNTAVGVVNLITSIRKLAAL